MKMTSSSLATFFQALPRELRNNIYEHILAGQERIVIGYSGRLTIDPIPCFLYHTLNHYRTSQYMQEALEIFWIRNIFEIRHDMLQKFLGGFLIGQSNIHEVIVVMHSSDGHGPGAKAVQLRELLACSGLKKLTIEMSVWREEVEEAWEVILEIVGVCKSLKRRLGAGFKLRLLGWGSEEKDFLENGPAYETYGMKKNEVTFLFTEPGEEVRKRVGAGTACEEEKLMVRIAEMDAV